MATPTEPSPLTRRERLACGIAMAFAGVVAPVGAWREATHHDGGLLVVLPAALMPVFAACLVRRGSP